MGGRVHSSVAFVIGLGLLLTSVGHSADPELVGWWKFEEASGALYGRGVGTASTGIVPLNEWSHVAAMVVGGSHAYYINGEPSGGGGAGIVLPGTANTAPVTIGNIDETARFYQGLIDDVYIYGRALSSEEVALLAGMCPGL